MSYNRQSKGRYAGFSDSLSFMLRSLCCHWALGVPVWAVSSAGKRTTPPPPSSPHPQKNPQSKTLIAACSERKSRPVCEQTAWRNPCSGQTLAFPLLTAEVLWGGRCGVCFPAAHSSFPAPLGTGGRERGRARRCLRKQIPLQRAQWAPGESLLHLGHTSSAGLLPRKPFSATPPSSFLF